MVREAGEADAPLLARMLHAFNREFGDPSPGVSVLERRVQTLVASGERSYLLAGDGPDGFAQIAFHASVWSEGPVAHLDELYVVPAKRGGGVGRALMEAVLALARERGAAGVEVVTGEDDLAARSLYESCGFANEIEGKAKSRSLFYELDF